MRTHRIAALIALSVCLCCSRSEALEIVAGQTVVPLRAFMDVTLYPGTPFNPGTENAFIPGVYGDGFFGFDRDAQVGTEINTDFFGGMFYGSHPALGSYVFGAVGGLSESIYDTRIENVVQDPADPGFATGDPSSFQSGRAVLTGPQFAFEFLTGPAAGAVLFTDTTQNFGFESFYDGLPPSPGTEYTMIGDDALNVLFNGQIIGTSSGRVLVTTPEPASIALLASLSLLRCRRRR